MFLNVNENGAQAYAIKKYQGFINVFVAGFEFVTVVGAKYFIELKNTSFILGLLKEDGRLT